MSSHKFTINRETIDPKDVVGKRCLLKINHAVAEYRVVELSPSGNYIHLMTAATRKFWTEVTKVDFVELLNDPKIERKKETGGA